MLPRIRYFTLSLVTDLQPNCLILPDVMTILVHDEVE